MSLVSCKQFWISTYYFGICSWICPGSGAADQADISADASLTVNPLKKPKEENEAWADLWCERDLGLCRETMSSFLVFEIFGHITYS
jgi:hypothetical protein